MDEGCNKQRCTGRWCSPVLQLPSEQSLQICASILAHMVMNKGRGNQNRTGARNVEGSRHGWQRWTGKQSLLNKAVAGKHSRQTIRPAQALKKQLQTIQPSQQNNSQQMKLAGLLPCSAGWWRECGGAGHSEGGLGPT